MTQTKSGRAEIIAINSAAMTQKDFFAKEEEYAKRITHGGDTRKNKRKTKRPLGRKRSVHIVAKASKAKGKFNLLNGTRRLVIAQFVDRFARKFGITIHQFQNVGNHLHIFASYRVLKHLQNFLRTVLGLTAREATGAKKGNPFGKFWDELVFTRVVQGFRDFQGVTRYIEKNRVEAEIGGTAREQIEDFEKALRLERRSRWRKRRKPST